MKRRGLASSASVLALCAGFGWANELPTGASVASGSVSIATPSTQTMTVTQTTNTAVVNWDSFSVGEGAQVDFVQPGSQSAILNRVTGSTTSAIHGQINANGQVHIVNPNGIFIGTNGQISTGGFVASTLDISDDDFSSGRYRYQGAARPAGVENQGRIQTVPGGYVALIGGQVRNGGIISVPLGRVGLGAGGQITLDLSGDRFLQIGVPVDSDDEAMDALVENSGTILANGGRVEMVAASARNAARNVVNMSGVVEARSVSGRSGNIFLGGSGGAVRVSGRVNASARVTLVDSSPRPVARSDASSRENGGEITIVGREIHLAGAEISADGAEDGDGGLIRIGGDFEGQGDLPRALQTFVDEDTLITADGGTRGDGGRIVLWADELTEFDGQISARGGDESGDGGFAEVSGRDVLYYRGLADMRAPNGEFGTVLMDPEDYTVPGTISVTALQAQLELSGVTTTTTADSGEEGNVILGTDPDNPITISWNAATELYLQAVNAITINATINAPNGQLLIEAQGATDGIGQVTVNPTQTITVAGLVLNFGVWEQLGALTTLNVTSFDLNRDSFRFLRALDGDGSVANPYQINDVYGLQGIASSGLETQNYVLTSDIDASGTSQWGDTGEGDPFGFRPIRSFSGVLDGGRFTINNLFINLPFGLSLQGMFTNLTSTATVTDLRLTNAVVNASGGGILAGENLGTIRNVSVSGTINGDGQVDVGGMVGSNGNSGGTDGTIIDSYSTATVSVTSPNNDISIFSGTGGLVGSNYGRIERSHATGDVTFTDQVAVSTLDLGGLAGTNFGEILNSYATGNVSLTSGPGGDAEAGGLTGANEMPGTITSSFSTGTVGVTGATSSIGGLSGANTGTVTTSHWDSDTSGLTTSAGGTALTTAEFQDTATFFQTSGWDFVNAWAPGAAGFYPRIYTTSPVVFALPDDFSVQYGQTSTASTTGTIRGGSSVYAFGALGDTLDTSGLLSTLTFSDTNVGTTNFGLTTTSLSSTAAQNYDVVSLTATATITPAPLTVTATNTSRTYGDSFGFSGTEFTTTGLVNADSVDTVSLASTGTAQFANVGSYSTTPSSASGTGLSNYSITYADGQLSVDPAALTITASDASRTYGDSFGFSGTEFTTTGLLSTDTVDTVTLTSAGTAQFADAGSYATTPSNAAGSGLSNYAITFSDGQLAVDPASLTITANDASRTYGDSFGFSGTEFTATGLLSTDTVDTVTLTSAGTAQFADVGSYATTPSNAAGSGVSNYTITYSDGQLAVDPASLTITANDASRTYGDSFGFSGTEFTATGLLSTDTVDTVTLTSAGTAQFADVGSYATTPSNAAGSGVSNYTITYSDGQLAVDPASLTITANDASRTYGDSFGFSGTEFTATGLLSTDTVDTVTLTSAGTAEFANTGNYTISASDAVGSGISNYSITFTDGSLTVTPAPLTITADDLNRTYGDTFGLAGTEFTTNGLLGTDTVNSVSLSSTGTAQFADVGSYGISASDASGSGLSNYSITYSDGTLTITPAALTITADSLSRIYGDDFSPTGTEFTTSGLLGDDTVNTVVLLISEVTEFSDVGSYPITASDAEGTGLQNYDITYVDGALTVTPAALTITANDLSRIYGDTFALDGTEFTSTGLLGSDSIDSVTLTTEGSSQFSDAASYTITASDANGTALTNYTITYADGQLTVAPAPLTVTANDLQRIAGDDFAFTGTEFTTDGLLRTEDSVTSATLSSDGAAADAAASSDPYTVTISDAQGEGLGNYDISYVDGTLRVFSGEDAEDSVNVPPPPAPSDPPKIDATINLPQDQNTQADSPTGGVETSRADTTETATRSLEITAAEDTLTEVTEISVELEGSLTACARQNADVTTYLACMTDALDQYADQLAEISNDLPPGLSSVAGIIRTARDEIATVSETSRERLSAATSDAEREAIKQEAVAQATASLENAQTEIRKAIALVRAEDPELARLQRQQGETILTAVETTKSGLTKAVGL